MKKEAEKIDYEQVYENKPIPVEFIEFDPTNLMRDYTEPPSAEIPLKVKYFILIVLAVIGYIAYIADLKKW